MSGEYVFGRGSNVLDHWLLHAEGFVVRSGGSRVGVVRRVVIDPARGSASALVLRSPFLHRRRVVLAQAVETVDPAARVLELEQQERAPRPSRRDALQPRLAALKRWSDDVDRHFDEAGAWLRPRLRAWALAAAMFVRRYARDAYARGRSRGLR